MQTVYGDNLHKNVKSCFLRKNKTNISKCRLPECQALDQPQLSREDLALMNQEEGGDGIQPTTSLCLSLETSLLVSNPSPETSRVQHHSLLMVLEEKRFFFFFFFLIWSKVFVGLIILSISIMIRYGLYCVLKTEKKKKQKKNVWLFVLRFYVPVNPMGWCRARSIYLTTLLLGRLSPLSSLLVLCTFFRLKPETDVNRMYAAKWQLHLLSGGIYELKSKSKTISAMTANICSLVMKYT